MTERSLDNIKDDIKSMLQYMEEKPNEFDVSQVNHYKEQLDKCNDLQSGKELFFYVSSLLNDWVTD